MTPRLVVIGGGLAGTEAAWQAAERGIDVVLYEMRPQRNTPAHTTDQLAELICSNSLGSNLPDRASGLLKAELRLLNSLIMRAADETAVPAGGALAVDRDRFAQLITERIEQHHMDAAIGRLPCSFTTCQPSPYYRQIAHHKSCIVCCTGNTCPQSYTRFDKQLFYHRLTRLAKLVNESILTRVYGLGGRHGASNSNMHRAAGCGKIHFAVPTNPQAACE